MNKRMQVCKLKFNLKKFNKLIYTKSGLIGGNLEV